MSQNSQRTAIQNACISPRTLPVHLSSETPICSSLNPNIQLSRRPRVRVSCLGSHTQHTHSGVRCTTPPFTSVLSHTHTELDTHSRAHTGSHTISHTHCLLPQTKAERHSGCSDLGRPGAAETRQGVPHPPPTLRVNEGRE